VWTDEISKYFTFEKAYAEKIDQLRRDELKGIRTLLMIRAGNTAVAFSLPVMSAVIAFCCYIGSYVGLPCLEVSTDGS
jgi:ATP-binding cassette subfamily C (CFTR/MRP) protein 1